MLADRLLTNTRILERILGFLRVDSNMTRLLIVEVSVKVVSNVMLRSFEHVPISRQNDEDA